MNKPNKTTKKAMKKALRGKTIKVKSLKDLLKKLNK